MRIALVEMNMAWEDKKRNIERLNNILAAVKDKNIQLLLCPEMSFTGFSMNTKLTAEECRYGSQKEDNEKNVTGDISSPTIDAMKALSKEYGVAIGFGWVMASDDSLCENHYTIVSDKGKVLSDYAKIHPFTYSGEDKYFKGGDSLAFCNIEDFCISTAICYDLRFPEIYQAMSEKADLIVQPACWPSKRKEAWNVLLCARAIENQCYMAGINCVGTINDIEYEGGSAIYTPEGKKQTLAEAVTLNSGKNIMRDMPYHENIYIYDIHNDVKKIRDAFPVKADRRTLLYKKL